MSMNSTASDRLVPVPGAPDILADPQSAQMLQGRLDRGEITADELRVILNGERNAPRTTGS